MLLKVTKKGLEESREAGIIIKSIISDGNSRNNNDNNNRDKNNNSLFIR